MWEHYWGDPLYQRIAVSLAIFIAFWLFRRIFAKLIISGLFKIASKSGNGVNTKIVQAIEKPMQTFILVLGIFLSIKYLPISEQQSYILLKLFRSAIVAIFTWALYNLEDGSSVLFEAVRNRFNLKFDKILIPFLSKVLRFITIALALGVIAEEWNYDVSSFIAGLGLGGLAFALAAKDTLANILAGVVVIVDKPFSIGDWIMTPSVEGTVEDITFRSIKVRTFANAVVTVPNSTLVNEPITNWSRMKKRRITFKLSVNYQTSKEQLDRCVRKIEQMLVNHPEIHKEIIFVRFDAFGEKGFEIFLYFFTNTTVWGEFLRVKEDVNFKIMRILEEENVEVALPSHSLYINEAVDRVRGKANL